MIWQNNYSRQGRLILNLRVYSQATNLAKHISSGSKKIIKQHLSYLKISRDKFFKIMKRI